MQRGVAQRCCRPAYADSTAATLVPPVVGLRGIFSCTADLAPRHRLAVTSWRTQFQIASSALKSGLHRLTAQQSADLYELILNRHRSSSFVITSNRAVYEWLSLFDDPILGNSALDRLANASYQIVIEGTSYRERLSPYRALPGAHGGD